MNAEGHFHRGLELYDAKRFNEAKREFSIAIEASPNCAPAYTGRGHVLLLDGLCADAIADFSKAIDLSPQDADAWSGRADARQLLGDFDDAIADYNEAISLHPHVGYWFHRRGDAYTAIGDARRAIEDYREAVRLAPDNPISHYFLASHLSRVEQYADSIHHYREALTEPDLDAEVYASFAWLLATCPDTACRDSSEAIEMATVACELTDYDEDQPLGILAAAYAANGDFDEAVKWQTKACDLADEDRLELQKRRLDLYRDGTAYVGREEP